MASHHFVQKWRIKEHWPNYEDMSYKTVEGKIIKFSLKCCFCENNIYEDYENTIIKDIEEYFKFINNLNIQSDLKLLIPFVYFEFARKPEIKKSIHSIFDTSSIHQLMIANPCLINSYFLDGNKVIVVEMYKTPNYGVGIFEPAWIPLTQEPNSHKRFLLPWSHDTLFVVSNRKHHKFVKIDLVDTIDKLNIPYAFYNRQKTKFRKIKFRKIHSDVYNVDEAIRDSIMLFNNNK